MKIAILGYGPIPEKLAHDLSQDAKVELFTSQKVSNLGVPVHEYELFLEKELDFDVLILAWRGLPKNRTQRADVLRYLVSNSPKGSLIVNLSSVAVYGQNSSLNTEETEPHPINDYGYSKLFLERYLDIFATSRVCNLRISNVFGHPNFDDIINRMQGAISSEKFITLVSPGTTKRDFISIDTLNYILKCFIKENRKITHRQCFNVSSGKSQTLLEIKDIVEACLNSKIYFNEGKPDIGLIKKSYVSNRNISAFLNVSLLEESDKIKEYISSTF